VVATANVAATMGGQTSCAHHTTAAPTMPTSPPTSAKCRTARFRCAGSQPTQTGTGSRVRNCSATKKSRSSCSNVSARICTERSVPAEWRWHCARLAGGYEEAWTHTKLSPQLEADTSFGRERAGRTSTPQAPFSVRSLRAYRPALAGKKPTLRRCPCAEEI